jgi:hypothetical protein
LHLTRPVAPRPLEARGAPRPAKLLTRSALLANTKIPLIYQPVMNTLLAIVIMNYLALIPHLKPPSSKMEKLLQKIAIGYLSNKLQITLRVSM